MAQGGLEIYEAPGFHGAVTVDPHAKFLAEKLNVCLLRAQQANQLGQRDLIHKAPEEPQLETGSWSIQENAA
jgi:hypothetical protein